MRLIPIILIIAALAGCTAEQSQGISRLQELESELNEGQPNYYSQDEVSAMRAEFPQLMEELRQTADENSAAVSPRP